MEVLKATNTFDGDSTRKLSYSFVLYHLSDSLRQVLVYMGPVARPSLVTGVLRLEYEGQGRIPTSFSFNAKTGNYGAMACRLFTTRRKLCDGSTGARERLVLDCSRDAGC